MGPRTGLVAPLLAALAWFGVDGPAAVDQPPRHAVAPCTTSNVHGLDSQQVLHAATITRVGLDMDVPERGIVVALATAMQESTLRNLPHLGQGNDHDSLGLFQQRPSQGWGSPDQVTDPEYAARAFYHALLRVDGWQDMRITAAAQAVQRSAYPNAYQRHVPLAQQLTERLMPCV